ncbi:MAG: hypothetical protein ACJ768_16795 [Gaiellaceae bacterium]
MRLVTLMVVIAGLSALTAGCGGGTKTVTAAATQPTTTTAVKTTTTAAATTPTETTTTEAAKASPNSTHRPDKDGDGSPDVETFRGKIGDHFTLVGQPGYKKQAKDAVKVTVLGVIGPFPGYDVGAGRQLIGVKVRFEGVGTKLYDDPQPSGELTVTGGETGKPTNLITGSGKSPCDNPSLKLRKGKTVAECLAFDVPKGAKPQVFEYQAALGYGDTGVWKLR